jgi:serine/threonine protein kinase/Tol biopolymer transport system component
MTGQTIGQFEVLEQIGQGGMGIVYRARDTKLNRIVALKVLPPEKMADPARRSRFVHEAQTASSLNHPNIVTVYDIQHQAAVDAIAMEFVKGRTLASLIGRKGLPLADVLKYGLQVADALAAAHAAGIVHRDLKPGNVMVTDTGLVKVLDFGLAKLTEPVTGDEGATRSMRPDDLPHTEEGTVLGTVAYMSPEQAEGKPVDARSDIFSFGSLLYEMVTGRRAFQGETRMSTLSAILQKEPAPVSETAHAAPRDLEKIIARCHRKDPARRLQHMDDVKNLLDELKEESDSGKLTAEALPLASARRPSVSLIAVLIAVVAAAGLALWWSKRTPPPQPRLPLTRITSDSGLTTDPALTSDGKLLAYASDRAGHDNLDIWVRHVSGGEPVRLTTGPADDHDPAFSPDGAQIAFRSEREPPGVYVISSLGGEEPRLLAPDGRNPQYSPDGKWIACWVGETTSRSVIQIVPTTGGAPRVMNFRPPVVSAKFPRWLPDGKHLLFLGYDLTRATSSAWRVADVETGEAIGTGNMGPLGQSGLSRFGRPGEWWNGHILFSAVLGDSVALWKVPIASGTWRISKPPERLTFGTGREELPTISAAGRLAFASLNENVQIWSLPDPSPTPPEPQRITVDAATHLEPSISADGKHLVYLTNRAGKSNIWTKNLETGRETPLTEGAVEDSRPMISALRLVFQRTENQKISTFSLDRSTGGRPAVPEKLCDDCGLLSDLSKDGTLALLHISNAGRIVSLAVTSRRQTILAQYQPFNLSNPRFSPDDRWIAFHALKSPVNRQILVAPVHADGSPAPEAEWIPITDGLGMDRMPAWSEDGNSLYWISERDGWRCVVRRRLDPATKKPVGETSYMQHFHGARHSMMYFPYILDCRLSIARDKIVFSLAERTGNIWMTELAQ